MARVDVERSILAAYRVRVSLVMAPAGGRAGGGSLHGTLGRVASPVGAELEGVGLSAGSISER